MIYPSQLTAVQKFCLAISLPVSLVFVYLLFWKSEEDDDDEEKKCMTTRQMTIEVSVPCDAVGAIIGVQGAQIKMIQDKTKTRINFTDCANDDKTKERTLCIRGRQEGVQQAELIVRQIIADQHPLASDIVHVPQIAVGRIIGRNGETIRNLCRQSKAKITVERSDLREPDAMVVVQLKGTSVAIDLAKTLLLEKVQQEIDFQTRKTVATKAGQRRQEDTVDQSHCDPLAGGDNLASDYLQCYVSAVEHPGHFWVQVLNCRSMQLDTLVKEMTDYYNKLTTSEDPALKIGDLVAAPFSHDKLWYRAQVQGMPDGKVDLYYVDYGDSDITTLDQLRTLRNEFRSLPFQAKECSLVNVQPAGDAKIWSEEAIEAFEELTHTAQWKVMMCKMINDADSSPNTMQHMQLIDTLGREDVDVGEELIRRGLAVYSDTTNIVMSDNPSDTTIPLS